MLIAAMPKTASTSLIYSLQNITKKAIKPYVEKEGFVKYSQEFKELAKYHKSMYCKSYEWFLEMAKDKETIYREHVLPEDKGFDFLRGTKERVVVLYRNPYHVFDNYRRLSKPEYTKKLLAELCIMRDRYIELKSDNKLYLSYRDLVKHPEEALKSIIDFWGLEIKDKMILQKKKYTGVGVKRLC